jgi:hypothetical protein
MIARASADDFTLIIARAGNNQRVYNQRPWQ